MYAKLEDHVITSTCVNNDGFDLHLLRLPQARLMFKSLLTKEETSVVLGPGLVCQP